MNAAFHRFVALRYVSNTRGQWSVVLASLVCAALLLGVTLLATSALCFEVGLHGALTRRVTLAMPSGWVFIAGGLGFSALIEYAIRTYSRAPRWLGAVAGLAVLGATVVEAYKPAPAWRALIAVGGAGTSTWTFIELGLAAVAVAVTIVTIFMPRPGGFSVWRAHLAMLLAVLAFAAAAVLLVLLERADPASAGFAQLAAVRSVVVRVVAGLALVSSVSLLIAHASRGRAGTGLLLALAGVLAAAGFITWTAMSRGLPYPDVFAAKATGLRFFAEAPTVDLDSLASLGATAAIALVVAVFLAVLLLVSRFMSFYSTVSIGGVWIGTMALVVVLSVMGGFESDLRQKILGSNAHIQITREHGDFVDWRAVRARIDAVRGVQASTPFATSEVVIASNNNYFNVIIKGIDTTSVAAVTDLVRDLDEPEAMQRLEPIEHDDIDLGADAEPMDFSGGDAPTPDARPADARPSIPDLNRLPAMEGPVSLPDLAPVGVGAAAPSGKPAKTAAARRVLTLNGVLVGRELTRQIHLSSGQEVRLISPLSDPSNPDATGTPIPFNRDYRVAGVFYTGMYEYDLKYVYVTLTSLQSFLDRGDAIDGIEVRVADPDGTGPVVDALSRELGPDYRVQDWRELNRNLFSALKLEKIAMFMVLAIIILVASFSIVGNLIMVVIEKGREIALLKTLGASTRDVVVIFVLQGVTIGFFGTVLGLLFGLGICWYLGLYGFPINPDVYYIDQLPVHVDYASVAMVGGAALLISVAATLYPAVLASRLRPAAGLRS